MSELPDGWEWSTLGDVARRFSSVGRRTPDELDDRSAHATDAAVAASSG